MENESDFDMITTNEESAEKHEQNDLSRNFISISLFFSAERV
jgi:hypothetical protein